MSGAAKKVTKPFKSIGKTLGDLVDKSLHPASTLKKWTSNVLDPITGMMKPKMPDMGDAPLMPDYDLLEKERKRRRTAKMSRIDTIMSDTLGG
jgi:hypothetical protein